MNIEAIVVEVKRLDVKEGDVVLITPQRDLSFEDEKRLAETLGAITRRTRIHFLLFSKELTPTVVAKADVFNPLVLPLTGRRPGNAMLAHEFVPLRDQYLNAVTASPNGEDIDD